MEELLTKELEMEPNFDYNMLFSPSKSSALDISLNSLFKSGISENMISIKKYLVAEDIDEELLSITDWKIKAHSLIRTFLKDWHAESDTTLAPIFYILDRLDPEFTPKSDTNSDRYKVQFMRNISVGYRFALEDAFARIYLADESTIVNLATDSLKNLINSISIEGIKVYVIALEYVDEGSVRMVSYKLSTNEKFKEMKRKVEEVEMSRVFR